MGQTGRGCIGFKLKVGRYNSVGKIYSQVININTNLIEYSPKTLVKKEVKNQTC